MSDYNIYANRRNISVAQDKLGASVAGLSAVTGRRSPGDHGMECPPLKRHKGAGHNVADCFGEDDDFTQDDLDEIDTIASQAFTEPVEANKPEQTTKSRPTAEVRTTFAIGNSYHVGSDGGLSKLGTSDRSTTKETCGNGEQFRRGREAFYESFEAQHEELKKKLKEAESQLLMKNGEIRVLRDSLQHTEQERDKQRKAQLLLEKERANIQSEKEKELAKKVQSLQSELHFKEAEMNEMKIKLQSCDRGNKLTFPSVSKLSPRRCSPGILQQERTASPVSGRNSFLSKEVFSAELPVKHSHVKVQKVSQGSSFKEDEKALCTDMKRSIKDDIHQHTSCLSEPVQFQGSILLNLLLQCPLCPSTLGLCHLLCISPDSLFQHKFFSSASSPESCDPSAETKAIRRPHNSFSKAQSLAISGLHMLALDHNSDGVWQLDTDRRNSGAGHLLPLLDYHIGMFCQALKNVEKSGKSPRSGSSPKGSMSSGTEESLVNLEDFALAALKALYHLVSQSREVVQTLLSQQNKMWTKESDLEANKSKPAAFVQDENNPGTSKVDEAAPRVIDAVEEPHPLFSRLLLLADPVFTKAACQRETVLISSLTTLNMLAERAPESLLTRFKCFLSSQYLMGCLSRETSYRIVCLTVSLLARTASNQDMAALLCSHLDECPFFRLYTYITPRPDRLVTDNCGTQLDLEVVRLLTKLCTQSSSSSATLFKSSCQCNKEIVRTLVVILHRQWLQVRAQECGEEQGVRPQPGTLPLLREALQLLHWLSQHDPGFAEHCLDVLHMYGQVIPAVRDAFRKIPCLWGSEELALEEICRPEADVEDMDIDHYYS
nr:PREDICTED: ATR-interacting protein [Lepisosteus oculatus]